MATKKTRTPRGHQGRQGTLAWLEGRSRGAEYWWNRSLLAAEKLGASYQSGLTLV